MRLPLTGLWGDPNYTLPSHAGSFSEKTQEAEDFHSYDYRSTRGKSSVSTFQLSPWACVNILTPLTVSPSTSERIPSDESYSVLLKRINMTDNAPVVIKTPLEHLVLVKTNGRITSSEKKKHEGRQTSRQEVLVITNVKVQLRSLDLILYHSCIKQRLTASHVHCTKEIVFVFLFGFFFLSAWEITSSVTHLFCKTASTGASPGDLCQKM